MARKSDSERTEGPRLNRWELRLYVASGEPRSKAAWTNLHELCEEHVPGLYQIEVVDLTKAPARSREDEILALPTVIRRRPLPEKRLIGSLSDREGVLSALGLRAAPGAPRNPPPREKRCP